MNSLVENWEQGFSHDDLFRKVCGYIRWKLPGALRPVADIEDMAGDVIYKAWRALSTYDPSRSGSLMNSRLSPWLVEIANNVVNDYLRRVRRSPSELTENQGNVCEDVAVEDMRDALRRFLMWEGRRVKALRRELGILMVELGDRSDEEWQAEFFPEKTIAAVRNARHREKEVVLRFLRNWPESGQWKG